MWIFTVFSSLNNPGLSTGSIYLPACLFPPFHSRLATYHSRLAKLSELPATCPRAVRAILRAFTSLYLQHDKQKPQEPVNMPQSKHIQAIHPKGKNLADRQSAQKQDELGWKLSLFQKLRLRRCPMRQAILIRLWKQTLPAWSVPVLAEPEPSCQQQMRKAGSFC